MRIFDYFISLVRFFGYLNLPYANFGLFYFISAIFWANLANANFGYYAIFFSRTKSCIRQEPSVKLKLAFVGQTIHEIQNWLLDPVSKIIILIIATI